MHLLPLDRSLLDSKSPRWWDVWINQILSRVKAVSYALSLSPSKHSVGNPTLCLCPSCSWMSSSPVVPEEDVERGEYKRKQIPGGKFFKQESFQQEMFCSFWQTCFVTVFNMLISLYSCFAFISCYWESSLFSLRREMCILVFENFVCYYWSSTLSHQQIFNVQKRCYEFCWVVLLKLKECLVLEMPTAHPCANWCAQEVTWPIDSLHCVTPKKLQGFQNCTCLL